MRTLSNPLILSSPRTQKSARLYSEFITCLCETLVSHSHSSPDLIQTLTNIVLEYSTKRYPTRCIHLEFSRFFPTNIPNKMPSKKSMCCLRLQALPPHMIFFTIILLTFPILLITTQISPLTIRTSIISIFSIDLMSCVCGCVLMCFKHSSGERTNYEEIEDSLVNCTLINDEKSVLKIRFDDHINHQYDCAYSELPMEIISRTVDEREVNRVLSILKPGDVVKSKHKVVLDEQSFQRIQSDFEWMDNDVDRYGLIAGLSNFAWKLEERAESKWQFLERAVGRGVRGRVFEIDVVTQMMTVDEET